MDPREIGWSTMDWIDLAQDKDQWRTLVKTVMNLRVHKIFRNFLVAEQLLASQEGFNSMELVFSSMTMVPIILYYNFRVKFQFYVINVFK
jgi:hypothetical protein